MISTRIIKFSLAVALFINVFCFAWYYYSEEVRQARSRIRGAPSYVTDDQLPFDRTASYESLSNEEKISYLLNEVDTDKEKYWLAHNEVSQPSLTINAREFMQNEPYSWSQKNTLFYDPRFTLAVYLNQVKKELMANNPQNIKSLDKHVTLPFEWSDWVNLTVLNEELEKSVDERLDCHWLQSKINKPTKYPHFCVNLVNLTDVELAETGFKSRESLTGYVVKDSPMNKVPHKQAIMQGKAHLLAYQENPINIIFLTKNGTYEIQVSDKKRIVNSGMFENYLQNKNIDLDGTDGYIDVNPIEEYESLMNSVPSRPLDITDDLYSINKIINQKNENASREVFLDPDSFDYSKEQIEEQIQEYETRLNFMDNLMSNDLIYDRGKVESQSLSRHEYNHYQGLKYSKKFKVDKEPTYYKLATLIKDKTNKDAGWHYEWRFFNGALRYVKEDWNMNQLEVREQIILDRLLRNWSRFVEEKGILCWIAHGPLLSWYWDGLMFPFDLDLDVQMPSSELNRLSQNYNMTLVVEDVSEGFGKFLIDCSTFIHHRDSPSKDNHIDARFIDVDTGTYIDITGIGTNNEIPPNEYNSYIKSKQSKGLDTQLYMDRRKHWVNFDKINPLRYSKIGGVPVFVPNDIMSLLNKEYSKGTTSYYFDGYYYVPQLRLWLKENVIKQIFRKKDYKDGKKVNRKKLIRLIKKMTVEDKAKLLESNKDILIEYYLTHKDTALHEIEKTFLFDPLLQHSILDLHDNTQYHQMTSRISMSKPFRKPLFDYEYIQRFKHQEEEKQT